MPQANSKRQQLEFDIRALNPLADLIELGVLGMLLEARFETELFIVNGQAHLIHHEQDGLNVTANLSDLEGIQELAEAMRSTQEQKRQRGTVEGWQVSMAANLARAVTVASLTRQDKSPAFRLKVEPDWAGLFYWSEPPENLMTERHESPTFFWKMTSQTRSLDQKIVADWHINRLRAMATDEMRLLSDYWQLLRTTGASAEKIQEVEKTLNK